MLVVLRLMATAILFQVFMLVVKNSFLTNKAILCQFLLVAFHMRLIFALYMEHVIVLLTRLCVKSNKLFKKIIEKFLKYISN